MSNRKIIPANNLSKLALYYNTKFETFIGWIDCYPELTEILKPFKKNKKKTLPPKVVKTITETLGDPEE
jgi:hypothetical protein